jgi:integrase/recombinase XerD
MRKTFRLPKPKQREIVPKEVIDEVVFTSKEVGERLILELQSRCGGGIGEVLKIRVRDIDGRKIIVHNTKSGKETEAIFMPEPLANRLKGYIQGKGLKEDDQVSIRYGTARTMINKLGEKVGIKLYPHDLRQYSATYASRNGVPLEIIFKVFFAIRT